jgi:hypothetical protein
MERMLTDAELEAPLDEETEEQIRIALEEATDPEPKRVAVSASFDEGNDLIIVKLLSGQRLAIPREDLQGLAEAPVNGVREIEIVGPGIALHWERLNLDFLVDELRKGCYGNRRWMASLDERREQRFQKAS